MLTKNEIKKRWANELFIAKNRLTIDAIASNRAVISDADLAGIVIGQNASLVELKSKSLYKSDVRSVNLSFAKISGSMSNSVFIDVNFYEANLDRCVILESRIEKCDFSCARLIVKMDDSIIESSVFVGSKFNGGTAGLEYGGRRVKFFYCNFKNAVFNKVEFRASRFLHCNFSETKFIGCDFRGVQVEGGAPPLASQFEKMDVPSWASYVK
jgi:uncharacterized protein YjbI with pentapeptide repeats